jgi:hypothetical protein
MVKASGGAVVEAEAMNGKREKERWGKGEREKRGRNEVWSLPLYAQYV